MSDAPRTALAILRRKQVERETGLSRSSIYRRMHAGTFPIPVQLGLRSVGWRVADIEQFLSDPMSYRAPQGASSPPCSGVGA
ncbi:helix-turn-helix transcriptional regulator [Paraburkholderia sp. BCC1885]|uniref:helix-turn-helix transcriptional regulator n=1 Tax=Paraburkholderia sp. BCC1885 TaxID=2562669 RepID=UPI0011823F70|nr:AlpA family phage regulatory protein [Paraburkholderia sp. BCC1885]